MRTEVPTKGPKCLSRLEPVMAAELGPAGYYVPEASVTFTPADGTDRFWLVGDVAFYDRRSACGS